MSLREDARAIRERASLGRMRDSTDRAMSLREDAPRGRSEGARAVRRRASRRTDA